MSAFLGKSRETWWLVVVGIWVGVGLWVSRAEFELIPFFSVTRRLSAYDRHVYLFGSDYMAADHLMTETPLGTRVLALLPDPYISAKIGYHIYPRQITPVAHPDQIVAKLTAADYDYLLIYYPRQEYVWGFVATKANMLDQHWTVESVYAGVVAALGEEKVGGLDQFRQQLTDNYGSILYPLQ